MQTLPWKFNLVSSSSLFDIGRTLKFSSVILHAQKEPPEVLHKKVVVKNFAKLTGKHLCQTLFFNKVTTLFKKRLWRRCFPVNFAKFLRTPFLQNNSGVLLLHSTLFIICGTSNKFLPSSVKKLFRFGIVCQVFTNKHLLIETLIWNLWESSSSPRVNLAY